MNARQTKWADGQLLHIHIAPTASATMEEVSEAILVASRGIEGDRYFLGTGTYSRVRKPDFREVTLFEMEVRTPCCGTIRLFSPDPSRLCPAIIAEI